jgi:hypothetical protein
MKKSDFPDICSPCRLLTREIKRAKLEGKIIEENEDTVYTIEVK